MYFCSKCKRNHFESFGIGKLHLLYKFGKTKNEMSEAVEAKMIWKKYKAGVQPVNESEIKLLKKFYEGLI